MQASQPLKIGVITDLHYLSPRLMENGAAIDKYIAASGRTVKYVPAILDKVLSHYSNVDGKPIDILLVSGDLTKDGEKLSHEDLASKLKTLQDKGTRVYVIPGNHDINMPNALGYKANASYKTDNVSPAEFADIYASCGYGKALRRDTASLSYVAQLQAPAKDQPETWLVAIDAARYSEYTDRSITAGRIRPETEKWLSEVLSEARQRNISVVGMMHWGLLEHIMMQSAYFPHYLVDDNERLADMLADMGMKAIFTGHFHTNDISMLTGPSGNTIYDIETGTLSSYPYTYRIVDYRPDNMDVKTFDIKSVAQAPDMYNQSKELMQRLTRQVAINMLKRASIGDANDNTTRLADIIAQLFIASAAGDDDSSGANGPIKQLLSVFGIPPALMGALEMDTPPADNNVTLPLTTGTKELNKK